MNALHGMRRNIDCLPRPHRGGFIINMHETLTCQYIIYFGGAQPVLKACLTRLNHCMGQTIINFKVCLVRMQKLPQVRRITGQKRLALV